MDYDFKSTPSLRVEVLMRPGLEVSRESYEPDTNEAVIKIGRDPGCHISIQNLRVSRYHLFIQYIETGWVLIDKESVNFTYVNHKLLPQNEPYPLTNFETIVDLGSPSRDLSARLKITNPLVPQNTQKQDLQHDPQQMRFFLCGGGVALTNSQYRVLLFMYEHQEEVCSHDRIGTILWNNYKPGDLDRYAAIHELINKLRNSLANALPQRNMDKDRYEGLRKSIKDSSNGLVITHRGFGYELQVNIPENNH